MIERNQRFARAIMMVGLYVVPFFLFIFVAPGWAAEKQPSVLVLYADTRQLPGIALFDETFRSELKKKNGQPVDIINEFLDVDRHPSAAHESELATFLQHKYRDTEIDAIVVVRKPALQFLLAHQVNFSKVPVVFTGISRYELQDLNLPPNVVGFAASYEPVRILEAALGFDTHIKHVIVINGISPYDRVWENIERNSFHVLEKRVSFDYWVGLPMAEIMQRLPHLSHDSLIFTPGLVQDGTGQYFVTTEFISYASRVTKQPLYAAFNTAVGQGAVGIYNAPIQDVGERTAETVEQLLNHVDPRTMTQVSTIPNKYIFDWRQLERFGISEADLPKGSIVQFREATIWEKYKWVISGFLSLLIIQTILIFDLLNQRRVRERTQQKLERQRQELMHLNRVEMLSHLSGSIAHEINQPLSAMLNNSLVAKKLIQRRQLDLPELKNVLDDILADNRRAADTVIRLRGWLKKEDQTFSRQDLNSLVRDVTHFLRAS